MKKGIKIVTIGGGSSYTPELIEGFIKRSDVLPIDEIWLVDIEAGKEKQEIVGGLAKRMIKNAGLDWKVHLTLDREEALKDADFVSTQFRVGLLDARILDERIPLSHGVLGQETNGAGGIFKALRTIPVILEIVEEMKKLCPNAWLVNFTNPSGMVTEAVIRYGKWNRVVGLCNLPIVCRRIASVGLGVEPNEIIMKFGGLNHFHWHRVWDLNGVEQTQHILDCVYAVEDGMDDAMRGKRSNEKPKNNAINKEGVKNIPSISFLKEQVMELGIIPCMYHRYYYVTDDMLQEELREFKNGNTRAENVKRTEQKLFELYKNPELNTKPKELEHRGGAYYSDAACELISSIYNNSGTEMVVSTLNNGAISDLPNDCVVEVSSIIRKTGPQPITWGSFSSSSRGLLQVMKDMELTTIEAAVTGSYSKALQAFVLNPLVPSGRIAQELLDEMLIAHKEFLPLFSKKIEELEERSSPKC